MGLFPRGQNRHTNEKRKQLTIPRKYQSYSETQIHYTVQLHASGKSLNMVEVPNKKITEIILEGLRKEDYRRCGNFKRQQCCTFYKYGVFLSCGGGKDLKGVPGVCQGRIQARGREKWARSAFLLYKPYRTKGLSQSMYMLFPSKLNIKTKVYK